MSVTTADCPPNSASDRVFFSLHAHSLRELGWLFPWITRHERRQAAAPAVAVRQVAGSGTRAGALSALQPAYRAGLRLLGAGLHPFPRPSPSRHHGRSGSRAVPVLADEQAQGIGLDTQAGAFGAAVPVRQGARRGPALDVPRRSATRAEAIARGAVARRTDSDLRHNGGRAPPVRATALRNRPAYQRRPAASGEGRRLRAPRDRGARGQGREGPGGDAAAEPGAGAAGPARTRRGAVACGQRVRARRRRDAGTATTSARYRSYQAIPTCRPR